MLSGKLKIIRALKQYHDAKFTPGVYEHSIFGKAALLLEGVHGRWIDQMGLKKCSKCKCHQIDITNFCPNCGADMRERKGND